MAFCKYSTEYVANNKTEVDNIFINDYLPQAPENCVKVYLYGLYLCSDGSKLDNTLEKFAKNLGMEEDEVIECFNYWQENGLCQILSTRPIEIRFIPLKNIFTGTKLYKPEKYEIFNKEAQELFAGQREITKNEYNEYYDFLERFHMEQEALLMIMQYCISSKKGSVGYPYILTVAKNWANEGVLTVNDVEEKLNKFEENATELGAIMNIMGIKRSAYIEEKMLYKKWTEELGYTSDVILDITKKLKKKNKTGFEKLDFMLMKFHSLNLYSIQEIDDYEDRKTSLYNLAKKVNNAIGVYYENLDTVIENYISDWMNLGFNEDTILEIAGYCRKTSIRTLEGLNDKIQKFFKLGILSSESLHAYLEEILHTDKQIQKILDKVMLPRKVNYLDREFYKTWINSWKMSNELIDYSATLASGKVQPIQYMNSILAAWHNSGIKNVEEAKKNIPAPSNNVKPANFAGRSYKKEELNALIQSIDEVEI